MITVAALTSGKHVPSSRFRVRQHIATLLDFGIHVHEFVPLISKYASFQNMKSSGNNKEHAPSPFTLKKSIKIATRIPGLFGSWMSKITWLERELLPGYLTIEPLLKSPYVFDVDDALWLAKPHGSSAAEKIAKRAAYVIAGNAYIANWFSSHTNKIKIIPTAIDTTRFIPRTTVANDENGHFTIGWTGSGSTLPYLYDLYDMLSKFISTHDGAQLLVVSDQTPRLPNIPAHRIRYVKWSEQSEVESVQQMDVGLMPLPLNEWTLGKCSFKMLQYMACSLPVIVSPVGMNKDILSMGNIGISATSDVEWYDALEFLYKHPGNAKELGNAGRMIAEQSFSREKISGKLAALFNELV